MMTARGPSVPDARKGCGVIVQSNLHSAERPCYAIDTA